MAVREEGGGVKALPKVKPDLVNEKEYFIRVDSFKSKKMAGSQTILFHNTALVSSPYLTISTQLQNLAHTL